MHPSLQAPTHARSVNVQRVLMLYNPHSGAQRGAKIAEEAKILFIANKIEVVELNIIYL